MNKRKRFDKLLRKYMTLTEAERMSAEYVPLLQEMFLLAPPEVKRQLDAAGDKLRAEIGLTPSLIGRDGQQYFTVEQVAQKLGVPVEEVQAEAARLSDLHGEACGIHMAPPDGASSVH